MKTKRIGTMMLASVRCAPTNTPAGTGRASFTAGDYSIQ
jgi:hypothetical protein